MASSASTGAVPVSNSSELVRSSPSLSTLVPHLLSAQRSLWCMGQVSLANDVIKSSRKAIESQVSIKARTHYIRNGSRAQLGTLEKVSQFVNDIGEEVKQDWDNIVKRVETARDRLENTVQVLRQTKVEDKLLDESQSRSEQARPSQSKEYKNLIDFVDESALEVLLGCIEECGRTISAAGDEFDQSIEALVAEKEQLDVMLKSSASSLPSKSVPLLDVLSEMEDLHSEMTANMESLIKHYDLCKTAVHHTEGGGAAAMKMAKDIPGGADLDLSKDEPLKEISEEEMQEIRAVIEKDAHEVEDVVAEIKADMEEVQDLAGQITVYGEDLKKDLKHILSAFHKLDKLGKTLPGHITQSQVYAIKWEEERAKILDYLTELEGLREFYVNFIAAYDNLLIEVGRRKDVERRINRIRTDAMAKIDRLIEEEIEERQMFKDEQGDFLPIDIWPGLPLPPSRYEFVKVENSGESIPDISASVINRAIKRVSQDSRNKQ